jgi:hypothetical protein
MEATSSFSWSINIYQITWCNIPEDSALRNGRRETSNFPKSNKFVSFDFYPDLSSSLVLSNRKNFRNSANILETLQCRAVSEMNSAFSARNQFFLEEIERPVNYTPAS